MSVAAGLQRLIAGGWHGMGRNALWLLCCVTCARATGSTDDEIREIGIASSSSELQNEQFREKRCEAEKVFE